MNEDATPPQDAGSGQQPEGAGVRAVRRAAASKARRQMPRIGSDSDGGFWRVAIGFFVRAIELVKSGFMKFLVVLAVVALLAPQAVRHTENPTLALVLLFVCILVFAFFALALELRDHQTVFLDNEVELLKEQLRQVVQQNSDLNKENDLLKGELRQLVLQRQSAAPGRKSGKGGVPRA